MPQFLKTREMRLAAAGFAGIRCVDERGNALSAAELSARLGECAAFSEAEGVYPCVG